MFNFAWTESGTPFSVVHEVEDEEIFEFRLEHFEGEFAHLSVDIKNPRIGFLHPDRDTWAWISWQDGTDAVPLFYGRLVGVPEDLHQEIVRLTFVARPHDWDAQKRALAETLRVAPYWDPIWIRPEARDDPDVVLEARSQLWHVDRITHVVTVSDVIVGEDGTETIDEFWYDDLSVTYNAPPARKVKVEADVFWNQQAAGTVDISREIDAAFRTAGTTRSNSVTSFTGEGLMRTWPEEGRRIGSGWTFGPTEIERTDGKTFTTIFQMVTLLGFQQWQFPLWTMKQTTNVAYEADRARTEKVRFTLEADVQALVTEPGDEEVIDLKLASNDIGLLIEEPDTDNPTGTIPIGDVRRKAYFPTDRGRQSLEYLVARARSQLLSRARTVEISLGIPFEKAVGLSCRMNGFVEDDRLPGGQAAGKIIGYVMGCNGDTGELYASVILGCTIGQGNEVTASPGTPDYVEDGVLEDGIQTRTGEIVMPIAGEVTIGTDYLQTEPTDDGLDLFNMTPDHVIEDLFVINGETDQRQVLLAFQDDIQAALNAVNEVYTEVDLTLRPLRIDREVYGSSFDTEYEIDVSQLMAPKTIDLEAGGTA